MGKIRLPGYVGRRQSAATSTPSDEAFIRSHASSGGSRVVTPGGLSRLQLAIELSAPVDDPRWDNEEVD